MTNGDVNSPRSDQYDDLTSYFDAKFASVLAKKGIISKSTQIFRRDVMYVKKVNMSGANLTSLKGIEYFESLTDLDCDGNQLTSLKTKNAELAFLNCYDNQLTSLDVSKNTELTLLECSDNRLTSLDVSQNTALTWLGCISNQLTSLDVTKNTKLETFGCGDNQLISLDISKNTAMILLICFGNPGNEPYSP